MKTGYQLVEPQTHVHNITWRILIRRNKRVKVLSTSSTWKMEPKKKMEHSKVDVRSEYKTGGGEMSTKREDLCSQTWDLWIFRVAFPINGGRLSHLWVNEWIIQLCVNEWMNEWMNEWKNEWMKEWTNKWVNEWVNEWVKEWVNERMNERRNERTNEWMNE